ncbi:DUF3445 domain-containing protein [Paralimibaculum aggregatum]|uniref:DUF3445 domain-containing protein n=1 Tax=Paralimibaculum aggregatum TaxID=3036245 RepID=A0ABQ6LIL9_9RHOB|nr:DUF3445 domain-containing protein [Limibaculum sp. NKW23]GMG82271.1 DUF3445 domain-containing protein [Limibaculum sp. NKW23]
MSAAPPWVLDHAPYTPFMEPRTARPPGLMPLEGLPLAVRDADFAAQMAERERLLAERPDEVLACLPGAEAAAEELAALFAGTASGRAALAALGRSTAEDWCLLMPDAAAAEYRLVAAVLCFPSRWSLAEKIGRPLTAIHVPVPDYDGVMARRVNRVFEALRPGRGLWRVNWLVHDTAALHLPKGTAEKVAERPELSGPLYLRTERQTLTRLPQTGAVAFGIKTSVCPLEALRPAEAAALARELAALEPATIAYRAGADLQAAALARLSALVGA